MWQIKYVSAENFMSFEKVEYAFDNKCYVVRGENLDNDGQQSNGGGKTSFADIAAIALLGYSLTGRNVKNCVNWTTDAKSFTVQLFMENPVHGLNCYITRKIYSGSKGQELSLLVNDVAPETLPTKKGVENGVDVKEGNTYILKHILNIEENDLLNYYFISKKNYTPFLEVNTDRKLEVIGRFSRADVVDRVLSRLEDAVKDIGLDLLSKNEEIHRGEGHIEALQQTLLEPARQKFEDDKLDEITGLNEEIYSLMEKDSDLADEQHAEHENMAALDLLLDDVDYTAKITEQRDKNSAIGQTMAEASKFLNFKKGQLSAMELSLQSAITCPKCAYKFDLKGDVVHSQDHMDGLSAYIKELEQQKILLQKQADDADGLLAPLYEAKKKQDTLLIDINYHKRKVKTATDERQRLAIKIQQKENDLKRTAESTFEDQSAGIQLQLKQKEQELQQLRLQLSELNDEVTNVKKWIEHFYDFKFYLGNKPIENICLLVNQYLQLNGSDLNLFIEGFKKLRSGEIRQALTPVVYRNWMNPQPLDQFSEGEKVRLNLTVDLAFQQLINSSSKYGGLDFYQNDELLNPLDSLGVSLAAKAFNQLGKTILLVSHSGADMVYDNTILVQKQNKTSTLV